MLADQIGNLKQALDRLKAGDPAARAALVECVGSQMEVLAHHMFGSYRRLQRWVELEDVIQEAKLKLWHALKTVAPPTERDFLALAAKQVRRTLLNLTGHYFGPLGDAANLDSPPPDAFDRAAAPAPKEGDMSGWSSFHDNAGRLPRKEREVFDLLWYQGIRQATVARVLGISVDSVQRRWKRACARIKKACDGESPDP